MGKIFKFSLRRDELSSFESLIEPHIQPLYKLAYRFTNNAMEAEDLLQDLLVKLYPKVRELEKVDKLRPWLVRVMYRIWVDKLRSQRLEPSRDADDIDAHEQNMGVTDPGSIPEQAYHLSFTRKKILQALERLSEEHTHRIDSS